MGQKKKKKKKDERKSNRPRYKQNILNKYACTVHLIYILKSVQQKYMITFRMAQSITIFIMDASDF